MSASIGIFGGTFDPVHFGHLRALLNLTERLHFDRVHWVVSAQPPHKAVTQSSSQHRLAMLKLALQDYPLFVADDCEMQRSQMSYTIDTIREFKARYVGAQLSMIIGADSLLNLPSWHQYEDLIDLVNWVVLHRPGYPLQAPAQMQGRVIDSHTALHASSGGKIYFYADSKVDISSTELRAALRQPQGWQSALVEQNLDSRVIDYIRAQQLYKIPTMNSEQLKSQVVEALENVKGQDIKVIDIADISDFADFMIVASGTSDTHVKALAREASDHLRSQGVKPLNEDGADVGEWVLVDFGDVVLHVMRPEVREYYDLEKLWDEDVRNLVKQHREKQDSE